MCGVSGLVFLSGGSSIDIRRYASLMGAAIAHRGPDDSGVWASQELGLALSHQRLSILDLSAAGQQPMTSFSGRFVLSFNGEIYNHLSIRRQLEDVGLAPPWRGHCDTETLLAAFDAWGLERTLSLCTGMWSLALLDLHLSKLHLAIDRFGEKPLYYGFSGPSHHHAFLFGSELAALRSFPGFSNPIDRHALNQYLALSYVPSPLSIYKGISKLLPGHLLTIPLPLCSRFPEITSRPWWQLTSLIESCTSETYSSPEESLHYVESSLKQAVLDQASSDVPLGTFLSGGIDSSLVAALLQSQDSTSIRTFTIGFNEPGYDESSYSRAISQYLGTSHTEHVLSSSDAFALIPLLPRIFSEPFADSSQLPTHLVCRSARSNGLTVALTGDGADELFGGYNRYIWAPFLWKHLSRIPCALRYKLSSLVSSFPVSVWDSLGPLLNITLLGNKANKLAMLLNQANSFDDLYRCLISSSLDVDSTLPSLPPCLASDPAARLMAWDLLGYLPGDILVKVDRASMGVGLETRAPFLDHRVAAAAWRLPMDMKIRSGTSKWALRQILYKYVPRELIDRPKAGFAIPLGHWLRGPLRDWADELLNYDRLEREGFLRSDAVTIMWRQHLSGRYDYATKLWTVLMWQAWLEEWG